MGEEDHQRACEILSRLRREWNAGYGHYSMFRLGNGESETHRAMLREALNASGLGPSYRLILDSLAECALSALTRMLDDSRHAKYSIKGISGLVGSEASKVFLIERAGIWFEDLSPKGETPYRHDENMKIVRERLPVAIERLHALKKSDLKRAITSIRNEILAHTGDITEKPKPNYAQLGQGYDLLAEVIVDFSLVVEGLVVDIDQMKAVQDRQAQQWWAAVETKFCLT